jgi:hypothetical protein
MKKEISDLLGILGYQFNDVINYDEISNLDNIIKQISSNNLKNFLFYNGIGISNYLENMEMIYKDLVKLTKIRPSEKLLIKARKQYIYLSDIFYNIVGIPQKSFIEFIDNWDLVEKEQLYQSIISDDLDDYLYSEEKSGIIMNQRQTTGKETPRKIRKASMSKYQDKNNKGRNNINIINLDENSDDNCDYDNESESINDNECENSIKYKKANLKIKNTREVSLNYNNYEKNLIYLKNMVRKIIFNRFIYNIFIDIQKKNLGKDEDSKSFKVYTISKGISNNSEKDSISSQNVEVILLNPILIV